MSDLYKARKTFQSLVKMKTGKTTKEYRVDEINALQTRIWLESILRDNKISIEEFSELFYGDRENTGTVANWIKGIHTVSPQTVHKIVDERLFRHSAFIYDLPIFPLLKLNITRTTLNNLFKSNTKKVVFEYWDFPETIDNGPLPPMSPNRINDSNGLFQRGDIYGFMGILMLLRKAELDGDSFKHSEIVKDAYRALPGFCRHKHFTKRWKEFYGALKKIHQNMFTSFKLIQPIDDIIEKQIKAKDHITRRELRKRSSIDSRFTEVEKPYKEASF